jgi:phosphate transport system substrate-binding protein
MKGLKDYSRMNCSLCRRSILLCAAFIVAGVLGTAPIGAQTLINGAGATFPAPLYTKWFSDYRSVDPSVQINYQAIGSGGGIRQITEGTVDFGASDGPMTDEQLKEYRAKRGSDVLHFPTVLGAAVPTYNVPGVTQSLAFTPEALANIFLGKITKWNDSAIQSANPKVKLPGTDIIVVHRSDGSGTTYCWTDFLSKVSPEWQKRAGRNTSVKWPVGLGAKGNEGVTGLVKQTPGSIGYVELIYAVKNKLPYGSVKNQAGAFVKADLKSVSAAAASAAQNMPDDFRVSITNAPGSDAYPISTFTWLLIPSRISDAGKREAIKKLLKWVLTSGQASAGSLEYAELPKPVQARELAAIAKIK